MSKKTPLLIASFLLFSLYACKKKEGPAGPQGPAGPAGPNAPNYYGVIAGHILQYDPYGIQRNHDLSKATVWLNDSTSTLTDTNGYYEFDNVISGNYNIRVSKTGFGETMSGYMAFVNDTLYKSLRITQNPEFDLTSFAAYHRLNATWDSLFATFPSETNARNWIIFVGNSPSVDQEHYLLRYIVPIAARASTSYALIPAADLNSIGINSGDIVYYAAYSYVTDDKSVYTDPASGVTFYTAIGAQMTDTTTAP